MNTPDTWSRLVETHCSPSATSSESERARETLLAGGNRVSTIKSHLVRDPFWWLAHSLVGELTIEERVVLLPELIHRLFNTRIGDLLEIYDLLLSLPKERLLAEVETLAKPHLAQNDDQDWAILLTLCEEIDSALAVRIAVTATENEAAETREVGFAFLAKKTPPFRAG